MIEPIVKQIRHFVKKKGYAPARHLEGLDLFIPPQPNKFYRFDGAVESIPCHLITLLDEFGFEVQNREEVIESGEGATGHCRNLSFISKGDLIEISVPFYRAICPEIDMYNKGHEDMHAIQHLKLSQAYPLLNGRLRNQGYSLDLQLVTGRENQASIAGLLNILQNGISPKEVFECPEIKEVWDYMCRNKR